MSIGKTNTLNKSTIRHFQHAFTIVELLIVIVVVAILAAIAIIAFTGVQDRAETAVLESDLSQAAQQLSIDKAVDGTFPSDEDDPNEHLSASSGVSYQYTADSSSFCLTATRGDKARHITQDGAPKEGTCENHAPPSGGSGREVTVIADGSYIQDITNANCPTERTRAVDARDNRTYWVQELTDGECWMLTNLAYGGGGNNTYADVKSLTNGTDAALTYSEPTFYPVPNSVNFTIEPESPSTSTTGAGQYGYLYNWCAAIGAQMDTSACARAMTPTPSNNISICPAGWRLPTGGSSGDFATLNSAVNNGSTITDNGLRSVWLANYSGSRGTNFANQGTNGYFWASNQNSSSDAYGLHIRSNRIFISYAATKTFGYAVRCIAS